MYYHEMNVRCIFMAHVFRNFEMRRGARKSGNPAHRGTLSSLRPAVSFPQIGLSPFTQDLVMAHVSGLLPAALRASFRTR